MLQSIRPLDVKTLMWATPVLLALLFAISTGCRVEPVVIERTVEVIREVEVVVEKEVVREVMVVVTATPAPTAAPTPRPTPVVEPTPTPRVSEDYYVLIKDGLIEYYADFPSLNTYAAETGGGYLAFSESDFFMDYLLKEKVITPEQRRTYSRGGEIKISLDALSIPVYKLLQVKGYGGMNKDLRLSKGELDFLLYYFDESLLDSDKDSGAPAPADGYVIIRDGSLETILTDADGITTRVAIDTVDVEEFLDYLLDQGRITVQQRDEYGRTNSLTLSLRDVRDAADFFDWAYSSDEGLYVGIDREDVNYIRDELLPLFSFGD